MAVNLSPLGGVGAQFFDSNGNPLSGGLIYTYAAGTSTPAATYTSSSGLIQHSNPIVLDAAGRVPTGEIWLTDGISYKFTIKTSADVLIATYDNLVGINSNFIAYTAQQEIQTATAGQTVFNLTTMQYQPATNNLSVFVDGVNQYGPGAQYAYVETDSTTVTFVSGLHVGASVKFTTASPVSSSSTDAQNVSYEPPFTASVATNVANKLSEYVSVKDFGAVGDGVTDDTTAFQNAILYASANHRAVYVPMGEYVLTPLVLPDETNIIGEQFTTAPINRDGPTLAFTTLAATEKAITIGINSTLQNLVIQGSSKDTAGTYGVYGGLLASESLGTYTNIINCYFEEFETAIVLSRWVNKIEKCAFSYCYTGISLQDEANDTNILENTIVLGNATGYTGIIVNGGANINIQNNLMEANLVHIDLTGGDAIHISDNYFESANTTFIYVRNDGGHNTITNNYMVEYGANASGGTRSGVYVLKGYTVIENNRIGRYDSGTNVGLRYGIRLGIQTDGSFQGLHIGFNWLAAVTPVEGVVVPTAQRKLITTPSTVTHTVSFPIGGTPDAMGQFFNVPQAENSNMRSYGYFREIRAFVADTINADFSIVVSRDGATAVPGDYVNSLTIGSSDYAAGSDIVCSDSNYNTNGKSLNILGYANRSIRVDRTTAASSGTVLLTFDIGMIRYGYFGT